MTTRQEWAVAFDLSVNAMRLSNLVHAVEYSLLDKDGTTGDDLKTEFVAHKDRSEHENSLLVRDTAKLNAFNSHLKLNPLTTPDVDTVIPTFSTSRTDIESDISACKTLADNAVSPISLSASVDDLKVSVAAPFVLFIPKIKVAITPDDIPVDKQIAFRLHYVLDDFSYNLQNIHHHTGEPWNLTKAWYDHVLADRIKTANYLLDRCDPADAVELGAILSYVESNLTKVEHSTLGQYIDNNLDKIPVSRRGWVL